MTSYRLLTRFVLGCPPQDVFAAVMRPEPWLRELAHVRRLERLAAGDDRGVGRRYTTVVAATPYRLRWRMEAVEVEPPHHIAWVSSGDLAGQGSWTMTATVAGTLVTSRWHVHTTRWWMRLLTPIAQPVFARNHDRVMLAGARRLADHLGAELVSFSTTRQPPGPAGADRDVPAP